MYLNFLLFVTENRQFHKFIILTMMLLFAHDSAISWEKVLGVTLRGFRARFLFFCGLYHNLCFVPLRLIHRIGHH